METTDRYRVSPKEKHNQDTKITLFLKLKTHFKSYCNHSSIHGFQYFGQNRTCLEKCWWIITFIGIISCCIFAIFLIYNKWQKTPIIVSLTTRDTPIYKIPYPGVTICPTLKSRKEHINFSGIIKKLLNKENVTIGENWKNLFQILLPLCDINLFKRFQGVFDINTTFTDDVFETLFKHNPIARDYGFHTVKFMETRFDFENVFQPILTDDGICFTFNMLSTQHIFTEKTFIPSSPWNVTKLKSQWIPQRGYAEKTNLHVFPRRALLSGALYGLQLEIFNRVRDIDYKCTGPEQGYKIILHFPTRIPRPTLEYTLAPLGKSTVISIKPEMITTSEVVKNYMAEKRDCYFEGEKMLNFFKIYSQSNCEFECLTNFTLKQCDCVAFYMPRGNSTPICGFGKQFCVDEARRDFNLDFLEFEIEPEAETNHTRSKRDTGESEKNSRCKCLRACNDITYVYTATTREYDWRDSSANVAKYTTTRADFTFINIFLDTNTIFTTERNELYGPTDFLSNFGGLLGLFTGFSVLSLMEIVYFFTLRIFGNVRLFGKWYGD